MDGVSSVVFGVGFYGGAYNFEIRVAHGQSAVDISVARSNNSVCRDGD